ncbi:cytochrome b [Salinarimonas soli]|uniref:Cytochrome b n=2 Tax=Salinarimonas soli TaxID=1638099 RepID=A0A5B2VE46_9HYPH|nr:cytochrome b [Salinarimonas soli]
MAVLILAMLVIGVAMVGSLADYHTLVSAHRPLGILILCLALIRLAYRRRHPAPRLPADLPAWQRVTAHASHVALYALMIGLPLVGWAMLSAARYPIVLFGPLVLPPIMPASPVLYAALRGLHTVLAYGLAAIVLLHLAAALMHGLVRRDGVLASMTGWRQPAHPAPDAALRR